MSIFGPNSVEVGIPYNYNFVFNPVYQNGASAFVITEWVVTSNINAIGGGAIPGYTGTPSNTTTYFNNATFNQPAQFPIPIQWGTGTYLTDDILNVKVSGYYVSNTGAITDYFIYLRNSANVTVQRLTNATFTGSSSVLDCDQSTAGYVISNTTNANKYLWTVTNGAIITSPTNGTSINVKPPLSGNFDVNCTISRQGGNPNYSITTTRTVSRTSRITSFTTSPVQNYICKSSGLVFQINDQTGISSVVWTAPNCTISTETIAAGKRSVTITPLSTYNTNLFANISVKVNFTGGCSATSSVTPFSVIQGEVPPSPTGDLITTQVFDSSGNPTSQYNFSFVNATGPYLNGITTVSPLNTIAKATAKNVTVTICNKNSCNNQTTCITRVVNIPAAPGSGISVLGKTATANILLTPNPTKGIFEVLLPSDDSGSFFIYDKSGVLVQEGIFRNEKQFKINVIDKIKNDIYIVKIVTENNTYNEQIILNR